MTEGRNDGMTEGRTKQTLNAPLPFYGGGIKMNTNIAFYFGNIIFFFILIHVLEIMFLY